MRSKIVYVIRRGLKVSVEGGGLRTKFIAIGDDQVYPFPNIDGWELSVCATNDC